MEESVQSGIAVTLASDESGNGEGKVLASVDSLLVDLIRLLDDLSNKNILVRC